ncbi:uncharacterized protein LOC143018116 isoform X2 [Oratosquilla oratoria]|uniref:uncharacterized protein LOC143018116 isoform X2 n=1 Tax=Oratosquilla oratoria TaxID=337810 RepID=UPI003F76ED55
MRVHWIRELIQDKNKRFGNIHPRRLKPSESRVAQNICVYSVLYFYLHQGEGMAEGGEVILEPVAHRTRAALEETQTGNIVNTNTLTWAATVSVPASYLSPSPSPDELIIRGRGRRSLPIEWSPIPIESPKKWSDKTPIKRSPGKGMILLRTSPRKRLQLGDSPPKELFENRRMLMQMSPIVKKCRSLMVTPTRSPPDLAIKGLSQNQLVEVLSNVMDKHPELKDEISGMLPQPDLKNMEESLNTLKKAIFKSLPTSRLASKTDSPAYSKASPHLSNFKKGIIDQCELLTESQQWLSLVDYTLMAWSYVRATPVWDSPQHNSTRKTCFKNLATYCLDGIKKETWNKDMLESLLKKLEQCRSDHDEMEHCVQHVKTVLSNQCH